MSKRKDNSPQWYKMDLHIHTPGSSDYQQPGVSYLDILQYAESKNLDMIAFTDHNTVRGYAAMLDEIEQLEYLEALGRMGEEETYTLNEYRRLLDKIVVFPGFEFTATFGFHILAIFPTNTSVRMIEHTLMQLNVPRDAIDEGLPLVGASSDVLTCYKIVKYAGGMCIAAHVNSTNGIANRSITFDEQLRMEYSQDKHLFALEATDLEKSGRTTANFFDGTHRGYPRRMHVVQGSDAHRMTAADPRSRQLGIGDRCTEVLLDDLSFEALKGVFESDDFQRTRPHHLVSRNIDHMKAVREEGPNENQSIYLKISQRDGTIMQVIEDVCAFANSGGGTVYIGMTENPRDRIAGVRYPHRDIETLDTEIQNRISPRLDVHIETQLVYNQNVIIIRVPHGLDIPYALDNCRIFMRDGAKSRMASRDEIVELIVEHNDEQTTMLALGEMAGII